MVSRVAQGKGRRLRRQLCCPHSRVLEPAVLTDSHHHAACALAVHGGALLFCQTACMPMIDAAWRHSRGCYAVLLCAGIITTFCWPVFDTDATDFSKKFPGTPLWQGYCVQQTCAGCLTMRAQGRAPSSAHTPHTAFVHGRKSNF